MNESSAFLSNFVQVKSFCQAGDEVVLIGRQGDEEIAFADVAARHELDGPGLTLEVRPSVQRVYGPSR